MKKLKWINKGKGWHTCAEIGVGICRLTCNVKYRWQLYRETPTYSGSFGFKTLKAAKAWSEKVRK